MSCRPAATVHLDVEVKWKAISGDQDPLWSESRVLYAWCHPESDEVVYLGKADYRTVRQRFTCRSKEPVWEHLLGTYKVRDVHLLVGEFLTDARLTAELLEDCETLLIQRLQPLCNVQCITSRTRRPGLRVTCTGDWPERRRRFVDR